MHDIQQNTFSLFFCILIVRGTLVQRRLEVILPDVPDVPFHERDIATAKTRLAAVLLALSFL